MCGQHRHKTQKGATQKPQNTKETIFLLDLNHISANDYKRLYLLRNKIKEDIMQATLPFFLLVLCPKVKRNKPLITCIQ